MVATVFWALTGRLELDGYGPYHVVPGIPMSAIQDDDLYYPIIPTVIKPLYYNGTDRDRDSRTNKA